MSVKSFEVKIRKSFDKVRQEMDDHLTAINENTSEIQSLYDYIHSVEEKIEKVNEKLETIQLFLSNFGLKVSNDKIGELNLKQQELFAVLMHEKGYVSYEYLSNQLGFTVEFLRKLINSLLEANIPVLKRFKDNKDFVKLDDNFRALQEDKEIVKIDPAVIKEFSLYKDNNKKITEFLNIK